MSLPLYGMPFCPVIRAGDPEQSLLLKVFFPFDRQEMFFLVVAVFACGDHITLDRFAAANERHDMIHGQFSGWDCCVAVVTATSCKLLFPPGALAQIAGLLAFPSDLCVCACRNKRFYRFPRLFSSSS